MQKLEQNIHREKKLLVCEYSLHRRGKGLYFVKEKLLFISFKHVKYFHKHSLYVIMPWTYHTAAYKCIEIFMKEQILYIE